MRWVLVTLWLCTVSCSKDADLVFDPTATVYTVGQKSRLVVTEGGSGSELVLSSFKLADSAKRTYASGSNGLDLKQISHEEIEFAIPPGITAGKAAFSIETAKGPAFTGEMTINRLMAMRDLSGKLWLLALLGDGTAAQFAEAPAGTLGFGFGHVAVGLNGRLLASTSQASHQLYLAWVGTKLQPSTPHAFDPVVVTHDLHVTPKGLTLVATSSGLYVLDAPTTQPPAAPVVSSPLTTGDAWSIAVDRTGARAAVIHHPGSTGTVSVVVVDLASSPPAILDTLQTAWPGVVDQKLSVGITPDGKQILAVDGTANRVELFVDGVTSSVKADFPAGETGATAVVCTPDGTFHVANQGTKNLSKILLQNNQIIFGTPLNLGSDVKSGAPVDLVASDNDEVVALLEHDMVLLYSKGAKVTTLSFANLFEDKDNGEVGGTLGIQP